MKKSNSKKPKQTKKIEMLKKFMEAMIDDSDSDSDESIENNIDSDDSL